MNNFYICYIIFMFMLKKIPLLLVSFLFSVTVCAEGTREIRPFESFPGSIVINKSRSDFAFFGCTAEYRLNISIGSVTEKIRFGLGELDVTSGSASSVDVYMQIRDPLGAIVFGPVPIPQPGEEGFIANYGQAFTGPVPGGYSYLEVSCGLTGDYSFEFSYPMSEWNSDDFQRVFSLADFTVVDESGQPVSGRVWSKSWLMSSLFWDYPPTDHRFFGKMMILSDDSVVTKVDINGMIAGTFSLASNSTGCMNTGNLIEDRKSRPWLSTYPGYKIFLNDPDSVLFPSARVQAGIVPPVLISGVPCQGTDFRLKVIKDGYAELRLEINPNPGEDPEDITFLFFVTADPGGDGYNLIHWDNKGKDGLPVTEGRIIDVTIRYITGMTHLPIADIEFNEQGFIIEQIRPAGSPIRMYWDDSNITGGTINTSQGCLAGSGCHTWGLDIGENSTINSWWFCSTSAHETSFTVGVCDTVQEPSLYFPNAFTPDGDGLNDVFRPVHDILSEYSLCVFNSFGEMVFSADSPDLGWDGTFKGDVCPPGTYVWLARFTGDGKTRQKKGTVILLRGSVPD